jgi:hypothetical protein
MAGGETVDAAAWVREERLTVFVFYAAHCACLDAHDARLRALDQAYAPRGVRFVMVDSEAGGDVDRDAAEARRRGYRFAMAVDAGGVLADALGARYAAYAVVADAEGRVRYRGGIDSDNIALHDGATFYLRDALDDVLSGRAVRVPEGKVLGCGIRR